MGAYTGNISVALARSGKSGKGIEEVVKYYATSTTDTAPESGWVTKIEDLAHPFSEQYRFLWTYEKIVYTEGEPYISEKSLSGVYGKKGDDANVYQIRLNQQEILKFLNKEDDSFKRTFSPEILKISFYSEDSKLSLDDIDSYEVAFVGTGGEEVIPLATDLGYSSLIYKNILENTVDLTIQNFINNYSEDNISENLNAIYNLFMENEFFIRIRAIVGEKEFDKYLSVRYGTTTDMASLNITASGIVEAIQSTSLVFDANGLKITNGGFVIENQTLEEEDKRVFYVTDDGSLFFKGTINGHIDEADGNFKGNISGSSGTFGKIIIDENGIHDTNNSFRIYGITEDNSESRGIIEANYIKIGNNASIEDYIKVGENAYIYNPDKYNNIFIKAGLDNGIKICSDGEMYVGDLIISGSNSSLYGGNSWSITPEKAIFNNIDARGTIHSAVFSSGEIQAVSGSMIFKPSSNVEATVNKTTNLIEIYPDDKDFLGNITNNSYIMLNRGRDIVKVIEKTNNYLTINNTVDVAKIESVIYLGEYANDISYNNWVIGVNSSDNTDAFLGRQSITLGQYDFLSNSFTPSVVIGDLSSVTQKADTTGIYANNAFLNGTLTTIIDDNGEGKYAGVNTINGVACNKLDIVGDNSKIIFWAGSEGSKDESIKNAPFQVTENGGIYASSGYFKGTIITESEIHAGALYAPHIYGETKNDESNSLTIHSTSNGIRFVDNEDATTLLISSNSFLIKDSNFIDLRDGAINYSGTKMDLTDEIFIGDGIGIKINPTTIGYSTGSNYTYNLDFSSLNELSIKNNNTKALVITNNEIDLLRNKTRITDSLILDGQSNMEYRSTMGGYDLYILEE